MNTSLTNHEPKLLVDYETGRVLRGDVEPIVSRRWLDSHPFVAMAHRRTYFVGPEAVRAANALERGETTRHLDAWRFDVVREVAGAVHLQRVES